jgi:hypothetical protein
MVVGTCPFCGRQNVEIDSEHVWPKWMSETLFALMTSATLKIDRPDLGRVITKTNLTCLNMTARAACQKHCNGGWMHDLETDVSQFMKPMITRGAITSLDLRRQLVLATWAIKTAMVYEFIDTRNIQYFTADERLSVKQYLQPPGDVYIWIGQWVGDAQAMGIPHYFEINHGLPAGYRLTFTAGQFLMQVLAFRRGDWQRSERLHIDGLSAFGLIQLWPRFDSPEVVLQWPVGSPIKEDNLHAVVERISQSLPTR